MINNCYLCDRITEKKILKKHVFTRCDNCRSELWRSISNMKDVEYVIYYGDVRLYGSFTTNETSLQDLGGNTLVKTNFIKMSFDKNTIINTFNKLFKLKKFL